MKRILIVTPDLEVGGVQRALLALLRFAPAKELNITVRVFSLGGTLERELPSGIRLEVADDVYTLESARAGISALLKKAGLNRVFRVAKTVYHRLGSHLTRGASARGETFDTAIAFSDGLASWYVARRITAEEKIAFVQTDLRAAGSNPAMEAAVYACYSYIYFGSEASRTSFLQMLPAYADKTRLLYTSLDPTLIRRAAMENPAVAMDYSGVKIATVGRLSHEKGVKKIPGLLQRLLNDGMDVCWYVVGDGPERESLIRQAKKLSVAEHLVMTGVQKNPYALIARCDLYVQPSDYEGYCLALAEARALHRPCVCCDFSGAREQLRDGIDGFVTGITEDAIYPAIQKLVQSSELRRQFSEALEWNTDDADSRRFWMELQ